MLFEANMNVIIIIMLSIFLPYSHTICIYHHSVIKLLPAFCFMKEKKNNTNIYEHVHECIKHKVNKILYFK